MQRLTFVTEHPAGHLTGHPAGYLTGHLTAHLTHLTAHLADKSNRPRDPRAVRALSTEEWPDGGNLAAAVSVPPVPVLGLTHESLWVFLELGLAGGAAEIISGAAVIVCGGSRLFVYRHPTNGILGHRVHLPLYRLLYPRGVPTLYSSGVCLVNRRISIVACPLSHYLLCGPIPIISHALFYQDPRTWSSG